MVDYCVVAVGLHVERRQPVATADARSILLLLLNTIIQNDLSSRSDFFLKICPD